MSKIKKTFLSTVVLCCLALTAFVFTACSEDEESTTQYYSMGFTEYSYSGPTGGDTSMSTIQSAFRSALGVSGSDFTLTGTASECDAQVKAACAQAERALQGTSFTATGKFTIHRLTTLVYTYSFTASSN